MATPPDKGRDKPPGSGESATQEGTSTGRQQSMASRGPQLQRGRSTGGRSTRSTRSTLSRAKSPRPPGSRWEVVKSSVTSGALQLVGLKQSKEEELHWKGLQKSIHISRARKQSPSMQSLRVGAGGVPSLRPQMSVRSNISREEAPVAHITRYGSVRVPPVPPPAGTRRIQSDGDEPRDLMHSLSEPGAATMLRQADKHTGRNQAVRTELKPDLWKVAFQGVRKLTRQSLREKAKGKVSVVPPEMKSFLDLGEEEKAKGKVSVVPPEMKSFLDLGEEEEEGEVVVEDTDSGPVAQSALATIAEHDEDFFGTEVRPLVSRRPREETDSAVAVGPHRVETDAAVTRYVPSLPPLPEKPAPEHEPKIPTKRRGGRIRRWVEHDPFSGGYDRGYGGLGFPTLLLRFKYKECDSKTQKELDRALLHKRPYFTYWLMVVHTMIMIISLVIYGFAPYGWVLQSERDSVLLPNLARVTEERIIVPSVWGGLPQQSLVLLGALYGPCMRRDRQLYEAIDADFERAANESGCCVRRDMSGCVQVDETADCPDRFADFVFFYEPSTEFGQVRGVCGMSPETCTDPNATFFLSWDQTDLLTWPICRRDNNEESQQSHLTCEITGRPCCVGIQALCLITTREHCDFLNGRFQQDAFLCSQVDCMNDICGLLPFRELNHPDQVYRLWIALFLHAGLLHLFLSLVFSFLILRHVEKRLGWFRTLLIYLISGIGGNLVSAYFVPYSPGVGPAGSILGIVAYMFMFLLFESPLLVKPWKEFIKLVIVVGVLLQIGLLPFIDNFAHIGGFVFGLFVSGILVQYKPRVIANALDEEKGEEVDNGDEKKGEEVDNDNGDEDQGEEYQGEDEDLVCGIKWDKGDTFLGIKVALIPVGIVMIVFLFLVFFLLFYEYQTTWDGFSYVNCIPFTDTICFDLQGNIRERDQFII